MKIQISALISLSILLLAPALTFAGKKTTRKPVTPQSPVKKTIDFTDPIVDGTDLDNPRVEKEGIWVQYGKIPKENGVGFGDFPHGQAISMTGNLVTIKWGRDSYTGNDLPEVVDLSSLETRSQQALMHAAMRIAAHSESGTQSKPGKEFSGAFSADPQSKQNGPIPVQDAPPGPAAPANSSGGKAY